MVTVQKKFEIQNSIKSTTTSDALYITGLANTGLEDLAGDVVTREALEQIAEQVPNHNLHLDHGREVKDILGPLISAEVGPDGLSYRARILDEKKDYISSLLGQGVNLGSSISGVCEYDDGSDKDIVSWTLTEISITGLPCDQATMGSVRVSKSFDDIILGLKKCSECDDTTTQQDCCGQNWSDKMAEENILTEDRVVELINTAFNEQREALLEQVRGELKEEFEAKLEELRTRVETLESQEDESVEAPEEDEVKADDEEEEEEAKADTQAEEEGEDEEEEAKADPEEDEEDEEDAPATEEEEDEEEEKSIEDIIEAAVDKALARIGEKVADDNPKFRYDARKSANQAKQHGIAKTPEELAKMIS